MNTIISLSHFLGIYVCVYYTRAGIVKSIEKSSPHFVGNISPGAIVLKKEKLLIVSVTMLMVITDLNIYSSRMVYLVALPSVVLPILKKTALYTKKVIPFGLTRLRIEFWCMLYTRTVPSEPFHSSMLWLPRMLCMRFNVNLLPHLFTYSGVVQLGTAP